ncbi:MAG: mechanosensitive ion channel, partial [Alphaproteobacteria bacterium]|nr:mechanosensitive ion channel [Alphaproteobacteria bacterium]
IIVAVFAALNSIGIDLTALAVFSGAVGLGIGFGLQKVISNLISGVILLMDKSVKPGDVIAIGDTFGWINTLSARYVSVITRDGIEHLIPNEELISQRVENWSYSNTLVRFRMPIGISYDSDVVNAMALTVEAAKMVERVRDDPAPVCRLMNFGDNAIELELRIWISDPQAGVANVRSEVLLNIWTMFNENGIEFPYTQRDLHIKSSVPLRVAVIAPETD